MIDKGYAHPLYTLELLRSPAGPQQASGPYLIPLDEGVLVARPKTLRAGQQTSTADCVQAVRAGLMRYAEAPQAFSRFGMDDGWIRNMHHWCQRALVLDAEKQGLAEEVRRRTARGDELSTKAQRVWTRLRVALRLAGVSAPVVQGRLPRSRAAQLEAMSAVAACLDDPVTSRQLADVGIGDAERQMVRELIEDFQALNREGEALELRNAALQRTLVVIRAGLLGDLSLYRQVERAEFSPRSGMQAEVQRQA